MRCIITRFAPAPTGYLHLGHVVNAVVVWGVARACGGRVHLRIEDHDRQRCRPEYESALFEDLAWLGFEPDEPPTRQSERGETYERALDSLRSNGLVYACACSRAEIAASRYPGACRDRGIAERHGVALRVRLEPSVERFADLRHGPQQQSPHEQCGDLMVRDREGNWSYQFAATVDDYLQGVTHVVRGDDLLESTGRQLQLSRLLGRQIPPRFLHHPLIMKSGSQKLSKSDRDTGVRDLRASGRSAESVIGEAAARAGLIGAKRDIRASDVSTIIPEKWWSARR
jgi:glutamyl-tRNA synthetase/glutamyl-Q tRNA(Asp) synthetase